MLRSTLLACLVPAVALAASARHFDLVASFDPPTKPAGLGSVAVTFRPLDPDVRVNETPAPRLKLDLDQTVLVDKQSPVSGRVPDYEPLTAKYLDTALPVRFPVAVAPTAPSGSHSVKASVVYFYCSTREAWCRRGSVDVLIPVTVR
jgi:hypothetical protein